MYREEIAHSELREGETLLWVGEPDPLRAAIQCMILSIFGAVWTGGCIVSVVSSTRESPGMEHAMYWVLAAPFLAVGAALFLTPLWNYLWAQATTYAITDQRVMIITILHSRRVQSFGRDEIVLYEIVERRDGSGDLAIARGTVRDSDGRDASYRIKFIGIPEVRSVERLLRATFWDSDPRILRGRSQGGTG